MENNCDRQPGLSYTSEDGSTGDYQEDSGQEGQEGQEDDSRKRKRLPITTYVQLTCLLRDILSPKAYWFRTDNTIIYSLICTGAVSYAGHEKSNAIAQSPAAAGALATAAFASTERDSDLGFAPDTAASSSRRSIGLKPCYSYWAGG